MGIATEELIARLVAAAFLGGLVGLERESHGRPAGFRTHILVSLGSSLIMLLSMYAFLTPGAGLGAPPYDPGRLAAQVVSGIGFLGAGTILREGANVRGLTTAASLWAVAGIGLAAGSGFYVGAVATTLLVVATLFFLSKVEHRWLGTRQDLISVGIVDRPGMLGAISSVLGRHGVDIRNVEIEEGAEEATAMVLLEVKVPTRASRSEILQELSALDGVLRVGYGN